MAELITFFILLTAGLVFSELFRRLNLPYVTALIVGGVILGPSLLGVVEVTETMSFLSSVGLLFLMFIAGTEVRFESLGRAGREVTIISLLNGLVPFIVGFMIGISFGYSVFTSFIIGTIFISSAIAVVIPSLESNELLGTRFGKRVISATVVEDVASLLALSVILQTVSPTAVMPPYLYFPIAIFMILLLKAAVPRLEKEYQEGKLGRARFEGELRFVFGVLLATVIIFELLGMHPIIAGFAAGLILAESVRGKVLEKVRTVSYGIFIPIFFVVIGMQMDLGVFLSETSSMLILFIVIGSICSKMLSGWLGGQLIGFSQKESLLMGVSTIPQLSTSLAAAYAALELNILTPEIISAIILLSIISTFLAPVLIKAVLKQFKTRELHQM